MASVLAMFPSGDTTEFLKYVRITGRVKHSFIRKHSDSVIIPNEARDRGTSLCYSWNGGSFDMSAVVAIVHPHDDVASWSVSELYKPYMCHHANCNKRFANKFLLKKHEFIHTGERPHQCPYCCKRFNRKDNLLRHKKTHESNHFLPRHRATRSLGGVTLTNSKSFPNDSSLMMSLSSGVGIASDQQLNELSSHGGGVGNDSSYTSFSDPATPASSDHHRLTIAVATTATGGLDMRDGNGNGLKSKGASLASTLMADVPPPAPPAASAVGDTCT
ncbi:unnamed protein product [Soboliphyme baturini]|uniref:C2H2-type domain-containing protein n=1 Tax=Soboliphyme baturini TaxID=241478 RepID=A0A183IMQ9_9BILA|nr:unnamed protein product [Soboliphyme baturini]